MNVKQFYDKDLGHASYAIESAGEVALVDPARDPKPYVAYAKSLGGKIVAVFETHPHADFTSCHLEMHDKFGATIYINSKVGVSYPHHTMEDGDEVKIGQVTVKALFTPGHSPDHNSYLLLDEDGKPHSVYTGDSLFVGDVGRPDLREGAGNIQMERESLAKMMYHTLKNVFEPMADDIIVYPAHGAGSLCGKAMSEETFSTIGQEKQHNWAFQIDEQDQFVTSLLEDQPFIPKYFPADVEMNRAGVSAYEQSVAQVKRLGADTELQPGVLVIDARPQEVFKSGHLKGALNIINNAKFETWLGAVVNPDEEFYLIAEDEQELDIVIRKIAKIGYEKNITAGVLSSDLQFDVQNQLIDLEEFKNRPEDYFILDVRNKSEYQSGKFFDHSVNIPLHKLRETVGQITTEKPIVVHCAGGARSALGTSILYAQMPDQEVYDLSEAVKNFSEPVNS